MRQISLGPLSANAGTDEKLNWIIAQLREIERASGEDPIEVADSYGANASFTITRQINVTSPSASNLANVLASLIADLRKRGVKRA
jgi:hypothetical protein